MEEFAITRSTHRRHERLLLVDSSMFQHFVFLSNLSNPRGSLAKHKKALTVTNFSIASVSWFLVWRADS